MRIHRATEIRAALAEVDLIELMAGAFVAYSEGRAVVAPVAELLLDRGDVHVKSGYLRDSDIFVVKIASGFPANPALGLRSSGGLMLLFDQRTGTLSDVLLDDGHLTDVRTAAAGALAARHLAPVEVERIAIFGTGTQARLQLDHLRRVTDCRRAVLWGRHEERLAAFAADAVDLGFDVETTSDAAAAARAGDLIVTTTAATEPLFPADAVAAGSHLTAVGSDTPLKHELEPELVGRADLVVADSIAQCRERGEIFQALRNGAIRLDAVVELGDVVAGEVPGRPSAEAITVADLTGVAVQDVEIARAVCDQLAPSEGTSAENGEAR